MSKARDSEEISKETSLSSDVPNSFIQKCIYNNYY